MPSHTRPNRSRVPGRAGRDRRLVSRRGFVRLGVAVGLAGLAAVYATMVERYVILVNHYRIPVPNLPPAFAGYRIVHLTDLHYGLLVPLSVLRGVVARTNRLVRDMVVCTGDYVHERRNTAQIDTVWPLLCGLMAPEGVHAVLGNHDHWADTGRSRDWLERSGQNVEGRTRVVTRGNDRLCITGSGDLWEDHRPLDDLLADAPADACRIVLAHNPDTADTDFRSRVDLFICGHTHGGQVKIPFIGTPVLPVKNKAYSAGLVHSLRGDRVFISRGIGWAVMPVRFNCFPEIAVLELVPAPSGDSPAGGTG